MKKIGICTLYFANNFGAILQAFALQDVLKEMGHEVEFIRVRDIQVNMKEQNVDLFKMSRENINLRNEVYDKLKDKYDAIIIGSDEMWNINNNTFEHFEEYFGKNLNCDKIISYAPSANGVTAEQLKAFYGDDVKFEEFTSISARDKATQKLVEDISGREAKLVLDPTLLVSDFKKYASNPLPDLKDYIILYGYDFSEEEKSKILKFAEENNKKVYSLAYKLDWAETIYVDIFGFLGVILNADYAVTNTFHGTLFSVILEKEFVVFSNNNSKVVDIINKFQMGERDGINVKDLNEIFSKKVDYEKINRLKLEHRKDSLEYLENAINQ